MADAGSMILEQQPMKVAEALILYLKGLGYFASLNHTDISLKRHRAVKLQQDLLGTSNIFCIFIQYSYLKKTE